MKISKFIGIFIILIFVVQAYQLSLSMSDPIKQHSIKAITEKVKRGDYFIEELDVERYRLCRVDIDRFLVNFETKTVMTRERVPGGAGHIGRQIVRNIVYIPNDAMLGKTILVQSSSANCVNGTHTIKWPDVSFEIVE